jgi:hypothetical protein
MTRLEKRRVLLAIVPATVLLGGFTVVSFLEGRDDWLFYPAMALIAAGCWLIIYFVKVLRKSD